MKTSLNHWPNQPHKTSQGQRFGTLSSSQRALSLALSCMMSWGTLAGIDRLATMPPSEAVMAHLHLQPHATDRFITSTAPVAFQ